jgi:hypothetical protein
MLSDIAFPTSLYIPVTFCGMTELTLHDEEYIPTERADTNTERGILRSTKPIQSVKETLMQNILNF